MSALKLALIVPGGVDRAGVHVIPALVALIRRLAERHEVHVFATHQEPVSGHWMLEGAHIHNIGVPRTPWRALGMLLAEHRKMRFQIIQSVWAGSHGTLAVSAGKLLRVPSLVHVAGGELVAIEDIGYGGSSSWRRRIRQAFAVRFASRVTAPSDMICALVAEQGVRAERLPLGVDLERWPPRAPQPRLPQERPRLIQVADLNRVKDQPTLLRALRLLADRNVDFHADIVGQDTLGGAVQRMASDLGLDSRVQFHGFLTQERVRPLMENAHIALMSSRHEAGPLAFLEAAVSGVPTVGTAVGHIAEWHPEAARAVACEDSLALADTIESLVNDDELRMALATEAHARALQMDADATAFAFQAIYDELVSVS